MSDQEVGKRMVEEEQLRYFLEAYEHAMNESLTCADNGESPDFVCRRRDGAQVGVELTAITRSPAQAFAEWIHLRRDEQDSQDALDEISAALCDKEAKRANHYRRFAGGTILGLQLMDCSLDILSPLLTEDLKPDFQDNGFVEVWLADCTRVGPYRDVELFGLKPQAVWGRHEPPNAGAKPYG